MVQKAVRKANLAVLDDAELVRRVLDRDAEAFRIIMQPASASWRAWCRYSPGACRFKKK